MIDLSECPQVRSDLSPFLRHAIHSNRWSVQIFQTKHVRSKFFNHALTELSYLRWRDDMISNRKREIVKAYRLRWQREESISATMAGLVRRAGYRT